MRIPSVIAMVVAVALTVIIGRRLTGSGWAGLFAGLIVALTPSISYYAQTARSYALVFACVLGSDPGPAARPGRRGRGPCGGGRAGRRDALSRRALAGLRRAAGRGRLPERAVPARRGGARGHGTAGPLRAAGAAALGRHGRRLGDRGPAARRDQRPGGHRRRLDTPPRPGEPADPLPRLLRHGDRGRRAPLLLRGGRGAPASAAGGAARPGPHGGARAASACRRSRRRCWWSPACC